MKVHSIVNISFILLITVPWVAIASGLNIGSAPKGDSLKIASKIIKHNFSSCKNVSKASRNPDGSIRATCDNIEYLVFTVFNAKEGKTLELAMNCKAAKELLGVSCYK